MLGAIAPSAVAESATCAQTVVDASNLGAWNVANCDGAGQRVRVPDGRVADLPSRGWTVTASAVTAAGFPEVPAVTIARDADGDVALVVEDDALHTVAVYGDAGAAAAVVDDGERAVTPLSTNPKCDNYSYNADTLPKWIGTFPWYRKSGISIPYEAIAGGINAMATGSGTCTNLANGATATYKGTTSATSTFYTNGLCKATDFTNVVDTGTLPVGTLAATCTYENSSEISYADVRFNTAEYAWYTGTSVTGCSGTKYDAQGVMTHEAGHVFGLGHVADSTLQVMKPHSGTCETSQRNLGAGDLAGMKHIYP